MKMKQVLVLTAIILIFSASIFAQNTQTGFDLTNYGVRIEPDRRLMVVLAALEAAGVDTALTEDGAKFRQKLKNDLLGLSPELRQKLVVFIEQYKRRHPKATNEQIIAPFVSMAYSLSPVPDLTDPVRSTDLPGDLLDVLDFAPLVREFYRRAFSAKLDEYVKDYQAAGIDLRPSAAEMVGELLDYLHTRPQLTYIERIKTQTKDSKGKNIERIETRERERRFFIVPEMLAPKGTVNFINVGDSYHAIVPPKTNLGASEVRRAYLQFVVDPLVLNNAKDISTLRDGIKMLLDERRKENPDVSPDVFLAVTRSLVAAADARQIEFEKTQIATAQARRRIDQMKTVEEKKAVSAELDSIKKSLADETALQLSEAYERGAVLSFYFADQLKGLEDSGFDIAGSLRDIILSLDTTKETNRLEQFAEARKRAIVAREVRRKNTGSQEFVIENPVTKRLLAIDQLTKAKNYVESEKQLKQLLEENPTESRIHYALGRVASLSAENIADEEARNQRLLEAKKAYETAIVSANKNPDPVTKKIDAALLSLSYVALARIYEFYGETEYAIKIYEAAIKVGYVEEGAYNEAVAAKVRLSKQQ
jgi:tetratricopeptide (TPR) repeat protein